MSKKCKILTVIGARPQFVKASVVSLALRRTGDFQEILVHTGQHFDRQMSDVFFDELELPEINYHLGIDSLSHGAMTGRMLEAVENVIQKENPDYVMVYGDTNSTLAGALAAKKLHKRVIHVEAGLRSFNDRMPEEINRILTDRISDLLFCPTAKAIENLRTEGFENFTAKIINSGDVMLDAFNFFREKARQFGKFNELPESYALCTLHRAENTDDRKRLKTIFEALNEINEKLPIVLPLHPRTKNRIAEFGIACRANAIEPVGYLEMINLLENCRLVITDSGGLQKEAFFAEKLCLTLRDTTEWTELVEDGYNFLTEIEKDQIIENFQRLLRQKPKLTEKFYGDGNAAEIIAAEIWKDFTESEKRTGALGVSLAVSAKARKLKLIKDAFN